MILVLRRKTYFGGLICIAAVCLALIAGAHIRSGSRSSARLRASPVVIVDPGHGGPDGGAEADGMAEKHLNLDISLRLREMLQFFGYRVVMTRTEDVSTSGSSGFSKGRDLKERVRIAFSHTDAPFLSIHMNKYPDDAPWGTQVFYSKNHEGGKAMASFVQEEVRGLLQPKNHRQIKAAPGNVYLMKAIKNPAIIVECGFLSNPAELERLRDEKYRSELAFAIACGYLRYEQDKREGGVKDASLSGAKDASGAKETSAP